MSDKPKKAAKAAKLHKDKMKCNKPQKTPGHKTKSHVVKACENGKEKIVRFGQQGVKGAGKGMKGKGKISGVAYQNVPATPSAWNGYQGNPHSQPAGPAEPWMEPAPGFGVVCIVGSIRDAEYGAVRAPSSTCTSAASTTESHAKSAADARTEESWEGASNELTWKGAQEAD